MTHRKRQNYRVKKQVSSGQRLGVEEEITTKGHERIRGAMGLFYILSVMRVTQVYAHLPKCLVLYDKRGEFHRS